MHADGYVAVQRGAARALVRADAVDAIAEPLASGTLYDFARRRASRTLHGRAPAYTVPLRDGLHVVVRHNTHGGAFAWLTGDRFLAPTRAPLELDRSRRLIDAGIPTPAIVAIVRYAAGGPFERADVATEEIAPASDLAHVMVHEPALHDAAAHATGALLRALARAGAHHADINIKNVLLQRTNDGLRAYILDVDRVSFPRQDGVEVGARNWARFIRSARKWREKHGAAIDEPWLETVRRVAGG